MIGTILAGGLQASWRKAIESVYLFTVSNNIESASQIGTLASIGDVQRIIPFLLSPGGSDPENDPKPPMWDLDLTVFLLEKKKKKSTCVFVIVYSS